MKTSLKFRLVIGTFASFLATLLATGAWPQSGTAPSTLEKPNSASTVVILAGRLIDVRTGHVTTNAYIVVEKDRIARIVTAAPAGMKLMPQPSMAPN